MNIRPAGSDDVEFLRSMLYEAAKWNPDWPREPIDKVLADPSLSHYINGWGREGDAGVIAERDDERLGAAWYRLFTEEDPGFGFIAEDIPELAIAVHPMYRRLGIGERLLQSLVDRAREDGFKAVSLSVAVYNRSRMLYERNGFEKVAEIGDSWTMRLDLASA